MPAGKQILVSVAFGSFTLIRSSVLSGGSTIRTGP